MSDMSLALNVLKDKGNTAKKENHFICVYTAGHRTKELLQVKHAVLSAQKAKTVVQRKMQRILRKEERYH